MLRQTRAFILAVPLLQRVLVFVKLGTIVKGATSIAGDRLSSLICALQYLAAHLALTQISIHCLIHTTYTARYKLFIEKLNTYMVKAQHPNAIPQHCTVKHDCSLQRSYDVLPALVMHQQTR